ncbi:unnamed protein product [Owenia fusiformis]|uniref:Uncharacterized protein n=1 Tax=Owenia fusiformis TaxID=6347 RepID=A0A8S4NVB0_OWEFU|nr:unnamed protein product [Owenia fusiformis]
MEHPLFRTLRILISCFVLLIFATLGFSQEGVLLEEENCGAVIGPNEEPFTIPYLRETGKTNIIAFQVAGEVIRLYNIDEDKRAVRYNLQNFRKEESPQNEPDLINYYMKIKLRHKTYVHIKVSQYLPGTGKPESPFLRWVVKGFKRRDCICGNTRDCKIPRGAIKSDKNDW